MPGYRFLRYKWSVHTFDGFYFQCFHLLKDNPQEMILFYFFIKFILFRKHLERTLEIHAFKNYFDHICKVKVANQVHVQNITILHTGVLGQMIQVVEVVSGFRQLYNLQ